MVVYEEEGRRNEENTEPVGSFGYLKINVSAANQALPVCNAQVMVYSSIEEKRQDLLAVLQTDCSGEAETISLPAPLLAGSQQPTGNAFNLYYVRIMAANYVTRDQMPVQIFPGVRSSLSVDMQTPLYLG